MSVTGLTIREIADILNIHPMAVKTRLRTAGIKAKDRAGKTNIYDESVVDLIRNVQDRGRPPKNR
jgi:DNA-directed RNA polymerase specialized sigma24 family protein